MGNSSSTPSSSTTTTTTHGEYDVFLSFRGTDTRKSFTSHLYRALREYEIKTFIDDKLIRGEEISEGLLSAIGESKISVIIFSENYAFSRWCLRELAEIMKYEEMNKQIVIPVFYHVDPSHVRKQIGSYETAFAKHDQNESEEEVQKWRGALTRASNLSGWYSSVARDESELVYNIVRDVWNKLYNISPSCDFKDLVGIEKQIAGVISKLCLEVQDFRIIGIWGMGGMGKTTIADAIFQLVSHQFERTYFSPCVRAESEKDSSGLIHLRDDIISKVLNEKNLKIGSPSIPQSIKKRLNQKKVLIVLDDVDKLTNFEILAGGLDRFGPGSRIILTTRDQQVLRNCRVEDDNIYKVVELNRDEAFQLFRNYAFRQNHPTEDLEVLSREVVKIAKNIPLVVKVLGSSLYKKSKRDWENAVHKFQRNVSLEVFGVLKISYNGLDEEEKGLFLDIACFVEFEFLIDQVYFAPNLLSDREFSLSGLIDKSLVTVGEYGRIKMHDLLREMGREIASKDRSRLWRQKDVLFTLKHNYGTDAVQGIFLSMFNLKDVYLSFQALMKMYNLRTLIITDGVVHLRDGGLDYLPNELRYLHWKRYPLEFLPSSFNPENLVELYLFESNIKQLWEGRACVKKLKRLDLSSCVNLIRIPDLSDIPSAESISLLNCSSLIEIQSIESPKNLHSLQLSYCSNLSSFPSNIHLEGSEFSLRGCIILTKFPHILGNIKRLDLSRSGVEEVPSTILSLSKLEWLDMLECRSLKRISNSICKLKSLDRLDLSGCCKLESFPDILEGMELKYLCLARTAIKELPPSIGNLNRLEELVLSDCKYLEKLPSRISNLKSLNWLYLSGCSKLEKLPPLSGLCSLKILCLDYCNLTEITEDIGCLSSLEKLGLEGNVFERLPKSIEKLSKFYHLTLSNCGMLRSLPELPSSLRYLEAMNCKQLIESLPDESEFELCTDCSGFLYFSFINCLKLNQNAVSNLFRDSLLKMQLMGTEMFISLFKVSPPPLPPSPDKRDKEVIASICLPGSEIPEWFCYKNLGSSINIPVLRNDCGRNSYIMGFAVCVVIGFDKYGSTRRLDVRYDFHIETSDGHKEGFFYNLIPVFSRPVKHRELISSDHILLGYNLSYKCYEFFQELDTLLANRGMSDYVGTSFVFNMRRTPVVPYFTAKGCKVKHCGIQPIYVQVQVMNSISISQDTEETSEPHPTRICTEAEGSIVDNNNFNSSNNNRKETTIEELDRELHLGHSSFYDARRKDCEVKYCGINPIYVQSHVMNSVAIDQDIGDTSRFSDTEETREPHPKRICTKANQCS